MKIFVLILLNIVCASTSFALSEERATTREGKPWGDTYKVSFYCNCVKCCGKLPSHPAYGITASGKKTSVGTIAVDKKLIPLGSKVWIEGIGECRAEDTGGAIKGKRIDVWCESHKIAMLHGIKYLDVKILSN